MAAAVEGRDTPAERRQHPRTNIIESQLVTVDLAGDNAAHRGLLIDVSEGGMAVQPFAPLTAGATRPVRLHLPGTRQPVTGTGMVAWVGPGGRAGIQFLQIPAEAREQLRQWTASELRAQRADALPLAEPPASTESDTLDLDAALQLIAERARNISSASGVAIALGGSNGMNCRVSAGSAPDVGVRLEPDAGLSGYCLRTGELVHCTDTQIDPRVDAAAARRLNLRSVLVVPVFAGKKLAGVLEVLASEPNAFQPRHVERLRRIAELLGGAIEENERTGTAPAGGLGPEAQIGAGTVTGQAPSRAPDSAQGRSIPPILGAAVPAFAPAVEREPEPAPFLVGRSSWLPPANNKQAPSTTQPPRLATPGKLIGVVLALGLSLGAGWYTGRARQRLSLQVPHTGASSAPAASGSLTPADAGAAAPPAAAPSGEAPAAPAKSRVTMWPEKT